MKYIQWFKDIRIDDVASVGGKNASLGEMFSQLSVQNILVPNGFAITADGYRHYIDYNALREPIAQQIAQLTDVENITKLERVGKQVRQLIEQGTIPDDMHDEIIDAYHQLSADYNQQMCDVAVRSSATAEDLPGASFAGQQETYLNIRGNTALTHAYKKAIASLFTDRAIVYRTEKGFSHFDVALSVGVQKMIRSDLACSGIAFSLDTETGFKDAVVINASYGLGEIIVGGHVTPDEFVVHKPTLEQGFASIIKKQLGDKKVKMVYTDDSTSIVPVAQQDYNQFSLSDAEILTLARAVTLIDHYYSHKKGSWSPMDVEWAKDGIDHKIYIVQARPETIHTQEHTSISHYVLTQGDTTKHTDLLATGQSIGQSIVHGTARIVRDISEINKIQEGDIIVTQMTDPDWVPAMKRAAGIVTERGGRTCHAAIVSRELNVPAIVGVQNITTIVHDGQAITLDCSRGSTGYVYDGTIPFEVITTALTDIPSLPIKLLVNLADPASAFTVSALPTSGVGLARIEFIITGTIRIHPMACVHPEKITDQKTRDTIATITAAYPDGKSFFVDQLACNIGMIAAAFYPRPVIVRFSDFKSNEYRNLIGGSYFEPEEENPMIGFRGASRYYREQYREAFALECAAMKRVRATMGLTNVQVMIPFVRTIQEAQHVIQEMANYGLVHADNGLKIIMMCEIPSNVLLIDDFSKLFDGFSIGSNDLTQMTLAVDRDSPLLADIFDERDPAVKKFMVQAIEGAHLCKRPIGICGQGPSDHPELAAFLIKHGIDSLSLNPDSIMPFLMNYKNK
jgi:pyruvate,water dikinase